MSRLAVILFLLALAPGPAAGFSPPYVVKPLADGVYLFSCNFYSNLFIVTGQGVIATDPVSPRVAELYAKAIREVTDQPVRYVIYSHDHTDHIAGGAVFARTAQFIAHENARANIVARGNPEIVVPQVTFKDEYALRLGGKEVRLLYFGENHSNSNIAIFLPAERVLMLVDMVYPGSVPFRDLPGTDIRKFLATLRKVKELDFHTLVYGHGLAGTKDWVDKYIHYFDDLIAEVKKNMAEIGYDQAVRDQGQANARGTLDAMIERLATRSAEGLRPKYGGWGGYDDWAVMNATRIVLFLIMDS